MLPLYKLKSLLVAIAIASTYIAAAQTQLLSPYNPSHEEIMMRYQAVAALRLAGALCGICGLKSIKHNADEILNN